MDSSLAAGRRYVNSTSTNFHVHQLTTVSHRGSFEVIVDKKYLAYSKLATGVFPEFEKLAEVGGSNLRREFAAQTYPLCRQSTLTLPVAPCQRHGRKCKRIFKFAKSGMVLRVVVFDHDERLQQASAWGALSTTGPLLMAE